MLWFAVTVRVGKELLRATSDEKMGYSECEFPKNGKMEGQRVMHDI